MSSQRPRIYTYKITFEEVPYYYYGVHKEKRYNEYYMGSPVTNKWCWELYTPKKQILEIFEFSDEGWIEARKIEIRVINQFLNDKWCLNENCGGIMSLEVSRKNGKKCAELKLGVHSFTKEERRKIALKSVKTNKRNGTGIYGISKEDRIKLAKELNDAGSGFSSIPIENRKQNSSIGGLKCKELKIGIFNLTKEEMSENGKKVGQWNKENKSKEFKVTSPTGEIITSKNIREFCKINNLNRGNFTHLLNGTWMQYNGWRLYDDTI